MSNIIDYLKDNSEKIRLVGYFVLILILALPVTQMLGSAWKNSNLIRELFQLRYHVGLSLEAVSVVIFGFFLGLLLLMSLDPKKRWQAFLLWIGFGLGLVVLRGMNLFLPNVNLIKSAPWLVAGASAGVLIGGGRRLLEVQTAEALEFRRSSWLIYLMVSSFAVIGFLELHIQYAGMLDVSRDTIAVSGLTGQMGINSDGLFIDAAVTIVFVGTVRQFVKYDAQKDFFLLGPRASGKSLFLIGAYIEALNRSESDSSNTPLNPSQDLMSMVEALDRQETKWIVEATGRGELKDFRFKYVHGSVFPTNIYLSGLDYAGEYLSRIPDALTGTIDEEDMDTTLKRLAEGIENADTLMLVVDTERFVNNEPLEIAEYFSVLQAAENKGVMIVATKADYLAEEFEDERGLEPHRYYDDFKEYVNQRLNESENIRTLTAESAGTEIHPVYYQTKVDENGNRVPMRDTTGSVMTVGFDELLDIVGRM